MCKAYNSTDSSLVVAWYFVFENANKCKIRIFVELIEAR